MKFKMAATAGFNIGPYGNQENVGEIKKKVVLTPRNDREKSNTVIYYKIPTKHRH
jgi:hypothetical protein